MLKMLLDRKNDQGLDTNEILLFKKFYKISNNFFQTI